MQTKLDFTIGDSCKILDIHTISSQYIGENAYGYKEFDTTRSELGEYVYRLKNKNDISCASKICALISKELDEYIDKVDLIVPVPPSNKNRVYQPTFKLVEEFARYLEKNFSLNLLYKTTSEEAKNGNSVDNSIKKMYNIDRKTNILLVDDLIRSGNTLRQCCKVLKEDPNIGKIHCLVMTANRAR